MEGIQPYSFEPTRKKIAGDEPEDESSGSDEIDINIDEVRSGNVSWCLCKSCRPMDTERRAFVVRRWESLIENWTVRNCRLDCEVTCIRISLSHFTFIFYRSKHQLYHGARFVWCCVQTSGCIANCFSLHPQHSMRLLNGAFGKQVWNNLLY